MHAHPLHQGRAVEVASLAGLHDHCQRDPGVTPTLPVGASVYVWAPWGRYDPSKLVSLGTNRWTFKTALGISNELGAWTLELVPTGTFFTDNTDFLDGHTHAQEPIYAIQAHVIHGFQSGVWVALDSTYFMGGRTSINGASDDARQSNSRAGLTVALPVDRSNSVKLYASSDVFKRTGSNFNTFGIAWQYRWGSGY